MKPRFRQGFAAGIEKKELSGPLAAWGVFEGDRPSIWEAVIV